MSELKKFGACPGCAEKCRHEQENPPSSDGEVEVLATLVLGGAFDSCELGDCDIEWDSDAVDALQQKLVTGFDDVHIELVDRAHVARLQAEVERLRGALKFYADREHYHVESGNWDTVSGEPQNILWNGEEPDFIEDGTFARKALAEAKEHE